MVCVCGSVYFYFLFIDRVSFCSGIFFNSTRNIRILFKKRKNDLISHKQYHALTGVVFILFAVAIYGIINI